MSEENFANDDSIIIEGAWSMEHAVDLQQHLNRRFAQLLELAPGPQSAVMDLSRLSELDACGCQLLVVFMENLRRRGISPVPCGLKQQSIDKITLLGFSDAFSLDE